MKAWLKKLVLPLDGERDSILISNRSYEKLKNDRFMALTRLTKISKTLPPDGYVIHFEHEIMVVTGDSFQYKFETFSRQDILTALAVVEAARV